MRDEEEQNEIINNQSLYHTSRPSHLRGPAVLTPDKNLFFRGPFNYPLLIMVYKKYDIAYNASVLVIFNTIFHSYW